MKNLILFTLVSISLLSCGDFNTSLPKDRPSNNNEYTGTDPFSPDELANINSGKFSKRKLLMNLGINVISPAVQRFYDDTLNLQITTRNLCQHYRDGQVNSHLENEVKDYWKSAMESYHYLESMMIGPMSDNDFEIRYKLYSFALTKTNKCSIDKEIVKLYDNPNAAFRENFNRVGLDALEYLYHSPATYSCRRPRGSMAAWGNLSELERKRSKCAYIQRTTDFLTQTAKSLKDTWVPTSGNLTKQIVENNLFGNLDQAVNVFSNALFYLDKDLKDYKLAMPLGINEDCPTATCPNSVEHKKTTLSFKSMYYNVLGFKALLTGKDTMNVRSIDGFGFDDYLDTVNAEDLKNQMLTNINTALANLKAYENKSFTDELAGLDKANCLNSTTTNRLVEVCALYQDVKKISDDLKNDFLVYLALKAPRNAQGDND
jgi:predicted lipoprotein